MQGTGVGTQGHGRAFDQVDEPAEVVAQGVHGIGPGGGEDGVGHLPLLAGRPPDEHGLEPVGELDLLEDAPVPLRVPPHSFHRRGAQHHGARRPVEAGEEVGLGLPLGVGEDDVPCHRLGVHAQVVEELEVVVLHVPEGSPGDPLVGEEPVEVAGAAPIEAQLGARRD